MMKTMQSRLSLKNRSRVLRPTWLIQIIIPWNQVLIILQQIYNEVHRHYRLDFVIWKLWPIDYLPTGRSYGLEVSSNFFKYTKLWILNMVLLLIDCSYSAMGYISAAVERGSMCTCRWDSTIIIVISQNFTMQASTKWLYYVFNFFSCWYKRR